MKKQCLYVTIILLTSFFSNSCGQTENKIDNRKPAEFQELLKTGKDLVLLDVRTPEEFKEGAIANSVNMDFYASDFADQISQLDKNKTYLVYCRSGKRSGNTAKMLLEKGYKNVVNLDGGINAWQEAGLPVTK